MSKMVTVRLDEALFEKLEAVRDRERFPTQSDFIREAIRRMMREERRNRVRAQAQALAQDPQDVALARQMAETDMEGFAARWEQADRGEL